MRKNILIVVLVLIIAFGGYLFLKNKQEKIVPPDEIIFTAEQLNKIAPQFHLNSNDKITSPFTVKGIVPAGWMFEGIVPVKLLDENKNVITQAPGEEVNPGAWMDEEPDQFTATLTFTTTAKSGYLVVGADNPSGLPENDKSYEIPVKF